MLLDNAFQPHFLCLRAYYRKNRSVNEAGLGILPFYTLVYWLLRPVGPDAMNPIAACPEEVALYYLQPFFAC